MKNREFSKKCVKNETKCMICDSTLFKVRRITQELIMLTCENCGEPHMIGSNSDEENHLTFWISDAGDLD